MGKRGKSGANAEDAALKQGGAAWFTRLKEHLNTHRVLAPIPPRESLSPMQEQICRLEGGHLFAWLQRYAPPLLQERAFLATTQKWLREPFVVLLTDTPGLVAAREILGEREWIACLTPDEFAAFTATSPDEAFIYHIEFMSLVDGNADSERRREVISRFPLQPGEEHLFHTDITTMGPLFARGGQHLLKWTGDEIKVLEEAFEQWVV